MIIKLRVKKKARKKNKECWERRCAALLDWMASLTTFESKSEGVSSEVHFLPFLLEGAANPQILKTSSHLSIYTENTFFLLYQISRSVLLQNCRENSLWYCSKAQLNIFQGQSEKLFQNNRIYLASCQNRLGGKGWTSKDIFQGLCMSAHFYLLLTVYINNTNFLSGEGISYLPLPQWVSNDTVST